MADKTQSKLGGARAGSGRKPKDAGQPRNVPRAIKVSQEVDQYLDHTGTGIIEDTIRTSKPFKEWLRSNASR